MAHEFSTAGAQLKYAVATGNERPTTGYTVIPSVKSMPALNGTPNNIQVTDLSDTEWHRFIPGLKDTGGTLEFGANLTADLETAWSTMIAASRAGEAAGKATWWEITIPNFKSFYFAGIPVDLGFNGAEVDSVFETSLYIAPNQIAGFAEASN